VFVSLKVRAAYGTAQRGRPCPDRSGAVLSKPPACVANYEVGNRRVNVPKWMLRRQNLAFIVAIESETITLDEM